MGEYQTQLDHTFAALADPTRRAILQRIRLHEARVTEIAEPFSISLNSVSKHIRILERARLVKRRKAGRDHYLRFSPEPLARAEAWIGRQRAFWQAGLEALDTAVQAQSAERTTK